MKKLYLVFFTFVCFFIFSLSPKAEVYGSGATQLQIPITNYRRTSSGSRSDCNLFGHEYAYSSNDVCFTSGGLYDYYNYIKQDSDPDSFKSKYSYMYGLGQNLYSTLINLIPSNYSSYIKDYYVISYVKTWAYGRGYRLFIHLSFFDNPLVYRDLNGLRSFTCSNSGCGSNPGEFKFEVFDNYISFDRFTSHNSWSNLLNYFPDIVIQDNSNNVYTINPIFYNYFYMSNFSIFPDTQQITLVPAYYVVQVINKTFSNNTYLLSDNNNFYNYGLDYFKHYAFTGLTTGVKSFYAVVNYETFNKAPYNGNFTQITASIRQTNIMLEPKNGTVRSRIYFRGDFLLVYLDNDNPVGDNVLVYACHNELGNPRENVSEENLCYTDLDLSNLNNGKVLIIYDEDRLAQYFDDPPHGPTIWFQTDHFNSYTQLYNGADDYDCTSCVPVEGYVPSLVVSDSGLSNFLDSVNINLSDDSINLSSSFFNNFNSAGSFISASKELFVLTADLFYSFSVPVKALLILIFILISLIIFFRSIK